MIQMKEDIGVELDSDNGDVHMWVDLRFNLGMKSTSVHLTETFLLFTYNKRILPTLENSDEGPMR